VEKAVKQTPESRAAAAAEKRRQAKPKQPKE
jgi:hypothetical protein